MFDLCYKQRGETFYLKVTKVHLGNLNKKLLKKFRLFEMLYSNNQYFADIKLELSEKNTKSCS